MSDIRLIWNNLTGYADINLVGSSLELGHDLESAVIVSLFSDHVADPGDVLPSDMSKDPRGWWADTYDTPDQIGSKLWQVFGRVRNQDTLNFARDTATKALQWMIEDQVAASVTVEPSFYGSGGLQLNVAIAQASGTLSRFIFAWQQEA